MGITIREPAEGDFFSWLAVYEDYAASYERQLTDQGALLVWSWLTDAASPERGLVAVDDAGALVGLVHFHVVPRPLDGDHALHIDDLFVLEEHRQEGTGRSLIDAIGAMAAASGIEVVQWYARPGDAEARAFYDQIGDAAGVVIYRLRGAQAPSTVPAPASAPDAVGPEGTGNSEHEELTDTGDHPEGAEHGEGAADTGADSGGAEQADHSAPVAHSEA